MKKISLLLVVVMCISLFAGCGTQNDAKNTNNDANANENVSNTEETEKTVEKETNNDDNTSSTVEPKQGGTFVVSVEREPQTYNPDAQSDDGAYVIIQNVFNKLVKINGNDQVVSDLAKSWEFSDDAKTITFHLQENVKWHDGEAFSSADVKWTFDQIINEKGFASSSLSDIEEITCPDDNTVVIKLKSANAGMLGYIAWFGTYIMPAHIYEGTDWLTNETNQSPIGTGPFKFVEHKKGQTITLVKNEEYWGDKPYLDKIIYTIIPDQNTAYQAWLNGEVDEIRQGVPLNEISKYENNSDYNVYTKLWPNKGYVLFNTKEGKFSDLKLRQAVAYGIDRDEIFNKALKGIGMKAEYFISPLYSWALNEDAKLPERDIEKAKSLIEEAGYKADENGIYFTTTIDTFPGFEDVVEVLKSNFKEFGVDLQVNAMDDASYDEKVWFGHNFELTVLGGYQGPDISTIANRFGADGSMNLGEYKNDRMEELFKQGVVTGDLEKRAPIYKEVQEIMLKDMPAVFFNEKGAKIVVKSYVNGHPAGSANEKASEAEFTYVWLNK